MIYVLNVAPAPDHAAYDVSISGELVGRIGYTIPAEDAEDWLKMARSLERPLYLTFRVEP